MKEYIRLILAGIGFCVILYFTQHIIASAVCAFGVYKGIKPDTEEHEEPESPKE